MAKKVRLNTRQRRRSAQRLANLNPEDMKRLANSGYGSTTAGKNILRRALRGIGSSASTVNAGNVATKDKRMGPRTKEILRQIGRKGKIKPNPSAVFKGAKKKKKVAKRKTTRRKTTRRA